MKPEHTFTAVVEDLYLNAEKHFLLVMSEKERMIYYVGPAIKQVYAEKIGSLEKLTLEAEAEAGAAKKLTQKIQAAVNRHEPFDVNELRKALDEEKQAAITSLDNSLPEIPSELSLSQEEADDCSIIYKTLLPALHPDLNPDADVKKKELYKRLVSAYREHKVYLLRLIEKEYDEYAETHVPSLDFDVHVNAEINFTGADETGGFVLNLPKHPETDYTLARELLSCFCLPDKSYALVDRCRSLTDAALSAAGEIEKMKTMFPFNAAEILQSGEKTAEYISELNFRKRKAEDEVRYCNKRIENLTGG